MLKFLINIKIKIIKFKKQIYDLLYDFLVFLRSHENRAYLYFSLELVGMFFILIIIDY